MSANDLYCPVCDEVRRCSIRERSNDGSPYFEVTCEACNSVRHVRVDTADQVRDKLRKIKNANTPSRPGHAGASRN